MNEFDSLKSLRSEVPQRSLDDLAPSYAQLNQVMIAEERSTARSTTAASHSRRFLLRDRLTPKLLGWSSAAATFALTAGIVGTQMLTSAVPASAEEILHRAAENAIKYSDLQVGEGQYLKVHSDSVFLSGTAGLTGEDHFEETLYSPASTQDDLYIPRDPTETWVWDRGASIVEGEVESPGELVSAELGLFYNGESVSYLGIADDETPQVVPAATSNVTLDMLLALPTGSGQAAFDYIDSLYEGGSASRSEDNLERILTLLRLGPADAKQRAALYQAIALVPDITSLDEEELADGRTVVGFTRVEPERVNTHTVVLIDPTTGEYVGERVISADGETVYETVLNYSVVDDTPLN